jgi:hypothetical protein
VKKERIWGRTKAALVTSDEGGLGVDEVDKA